MPVNRSGVLGGPTLDAGNPIPGPGGGPGGPGGTPAAPGDAFYLLTTANAGLPNGVVYSGPVTYTNTGFPPASTTALWGDYSVSPTILRYYDVPTAGWLPIPGSGTSAALLNGSGVPGSGLGSNNDYYVNVASGSGNGDLYQKQTGAWVLVGNIAGPAGAGINPLGAWAGGTTYHIGDVVTYAGSGYVAVTTSIAVTPGSDPTKWQLIAAGNSLILNSSGDTTPGYLSAKLAVSGYWTWTTVNAGGNETLQIGFASQAANTVLAAPIGSSGVPTYRLLDGADIPIDGTTIVNSGGVLTAPGTSGAAALPTDYISGCTLTYVSATQVSVGTGTAYIPSASAAVTVTAAITLTPTLAVSTLYYVYLTNATTATVSSTAPTSNYQGAAWEDGSGHRYVGSFLTDSSAAIIRFTRVGNRVKYTVQLPPVVFTSSGGSNPSSASISPYMPVTSTTLHARLYIVASAATDVYFGHVSGSPVLASVRLILDAGAKLVQYVEISTSSTQQIYMSIPVNSCSLWCAGYIEDR